jgi:uncharacterized protein (DUF1015 family)
LRYRDECPPAEIRDPEAAPHFVLMMLVGMSDPGLIILPTHRLVTGVGRPDAGKLAAIVGESFHLETIGTGEKGARETWELIQADGTQRALGFGTTEDGVWQLARLKDGAGLMERLAPDHSAEWRQLAVSVLHVLVLGELFAKRRSCEPHCQYVHLLQEVIDVAARKDCELAVLVPPASMTDVAQIAGKREKMPPKSTYFYPKLLSGLVLNSLKGN